MKHTIKDILEQIELVKAKLKVAEAYANIGLVDCYTVQLEALKEELTLLTQKVA